MKLYKKIAVLITVVLASSCSLDNLQQDPNAVQTDQVLANLILNSIQRQLAVVVNAANTSGAQHTRLLNGAGTIYLNATTPQTFDGLWTNAYAGILQDANQLITIADKNGFWRASSLKNSAPNGYTICRRAVTPDQITQQNSCRGQG